MSSMRGSRIRGSGRKKRRGESAPRPSQPKANGLEAGSLEVQLWEAYRILMMGAA